MKNESHFQYLKKLNIYMKYRNKYSSSERKLIRDELRKEFYQ